MHVNQFLKSKISSQILKFLILNRSSDKWLARNDISILENYIIQQKYILNQELLSLERLSDELQVMKRKLIK